MPAVIAVQDKKGWLYSFLASINHNTGELLARWYKDQGKAKRLMAFDTLLRLPSDPYLLDENAMTKPMRANTLDEVYETYNRCTNFFLLHDRSKPRWVYSRGPNDVGSHTVNPEQDISADTVWIQVLFETKHKKRWMTVVVFFGEERALTSGPYPMSDTIREQVQRVEGMGRTLHNFLYLKENAQQEKASVLLTDSIMYRLQEDRHG